MLTPEPLCTLAWSGGVSGVKVYRITSSLFLERVGAEDVDAAAVVRVEELVDGRVAVLRDRREVRLLLLRV